MTQKFRTVLFSALSVFLLAQASAQAAEVKAIKGNSVLLDINGIDAKEGGQYYVLNMDGKKIAIIQISKIRDDKAVATVLKGKAEVGGGVMERPGPPIATDGQGNAESSSPNRIISTRKKLSIGGFLNYAMNSFSMSVGPQNSSARVSASMTGSSIGATGFGDYNLNPRFTIRAGAGIDTFSATGSISQTYCGGGTTAGCAVNFTYLGLLGEAQFNYLTGKYRAWIGAGGEFLIQISASTNIPNLSTSGGTNEVLLVGTGVDIPLNSKSSIPVALEYGYFPGSSVTASALYLRAGYEISF